MDLFEMNLTTQYPIHVITKKEVKQIIKTINRPLSTEEVLKESEKMMQLDKYKRQQYLMRYKNKYSNDNN